MNFLTISTFLTFLASTNAFALFGVANSEPTIEERDNVLWLTEKTLDMALKKYKSILIHFHPSAINCVTCKHVNDEFAAAAKILKEENEENIRLAVIDVSKEPDFKEKHGIKTYPTVKFFKKGEEDEDLIGHGHYIGSWHSHTIVAWLRKKNGESAYRKLHSMEEVKEFAEDNDAAVVGVFKDPNGPEAKAFINASHQVLDDLVNFGLVIPDEEMLKKEFAGSGKTAKIYIMKKFDELLVVYPDNKPFDSVKDIVDFVRLRAFRYIIDFTPGAEEVQRSFGNPHIHKHIALFAAKSDPDIQV